MHTNRQACRPSMRGTHACRFVRFWGFWGSKVHKNERFPAFGRWRTAVKSLTSLALSSAEKSVTVQTTKTRKP